MDITHITSLLGGIALFLYGMSIMGAGLEKLAFDIHALFPRMCSTCLMLIILDLWHCTNWDGSLANTISFLSRCTPKRILPEEQ